MKELRVEIPEGLADEIDGLIQAGWFTNAGEVTRLALAEFVRGHRFELLERFQREDIAWARRQREARG